MCFSGFDAINIPRACPGIFFLNHRLQECLNHGFKGFKEYTGAGYMIETPNHISCSCVFFKSFKSVVQTILSLRETNSPNYLILENANGFKNTDSTFSTIFPFFSDSSFALIHIGSARNASQVFFACSSLVNANI